MIDGQVNPQIVQMLLALLKGGGQTQKMPLPGNAPPAPSGPPAPPAGPPKAPPSGPAKMKKAPPKKTK